MNFGIVSLGEKEIVSTVTQLPIPQRLRGKKKTLIFLITKLYIKQISSSFSHRSFTEAEVTTEAKRS